MPGERHGVDQPVDRRAAGFDGDAQDDRRELEVVCGVADACELRRFVASVAVHHVVRGERLPSAAAEAIDPLGAADPANRAEAIEKAGVVQHLQPFLCGPDSGLAPAEDHELAGGEVVDVVQQRHDA
jgi:hypothetical protein